MCGWLLLKEKLTFDKVSHLISEVTSGWQRRRNSVDSCSVLSVSDMSGCSGSLLLVSASQLKSRYDPLQGGLPNCPMH